MERTVIDMTTLTAETNDPSKLLRLLIEAVNVTHREGERPEVMVGGVRYRGYDLLKVASLLPDEELRPEDQALVAEIFQKRQKTYSQTGANLAHRANGIASNKRMVAAMRTPSAMAHARTQAGDWEVRELFNGRGLSERTVKALMDGGIDAPERLLFLADAVVKQCPGVGKASLEEVKAYRTRFGPGE
jgi:hypothetical protein